jgi:hypothetical protein
MPGRIANCCSADCSRPCGSISCFGCGLGSGGGAGTDLPAAVIRAMR